VRKNIDRARIETIVRERLMQEGRTDAEIEAAVQQIHSAAPKTLMAYARPRWEYKSEFAVLGLPLIHIVTGRDTQGRVGKAVGVIAIGRMAFGVVPIGQLAIGILPIGQFALGAIFALGQLALAGYDAVGQVAVASHFSLGQFALAASAIGQLAVGRYVLCQVGVGQHVYSTKVKDPEVFDHFREMFDWLLSNLS
jgi:hypothetical protein